MRSLAPLVVSWVLTLGAAAVPADAAPLAVGTSGDYAPFSSPNADDNLVGFDIILARKLSWHLQRPLDFMTFRWSDLDKKATQGSFDVVASGVTIRPDRSLIGRFTRPYAVSEAVVLIRPQDASRFPSLAKLDRPETRIAVNRGGHLERVARQRFAAARVEPVSDNRALLGPLLRGDAEAVVTDSIEEEILRAQQPDLVRLASFPRDRKALFVPFVLKNGGDARALHAAVDGWLGAHNAGLDELRREWLGPKGALSDGEARAEAIAALVDQRLGVAPWVAAAKRAAGLPIEDREREKVVLVTAAERARAAGLPEEPIVGLFALLIEASKDVQRAAPPVEGGPGLPELRAIMSDLDERLVAELAAAPQLRRKPWARLHRAIDALDWPGLTSERRRALAGALAR